MTLKKQSIRKNMHILANGDSISKEELILISENWNEVQENFFRKMLKQGGKFKVAGIKYEVKIDERIDLDSNRKPPVNLPPIPGERTF